uniref:Granulin a n=1 Tax=Oryzias latipes TaxID=8090 RepID=A0A3P9IZY2_ORYLA
MQKWVVICWVSLALVPSFSNLSVKMEDVPCDGSTSCPDQTTCCKTQEGGWACCPLPEAVCCADGEHCCPADYKCKEENTSCVKGEVVIPWYTKIPATDSIQADSSFVQCSAVHQCPEHMSCCRLFTGEWGCCPELEQQRPREHSKEQHAQKQ